MSQIAKEVLTAVIIYNSVSNKTCLQLHFVCYWHWFFFGDEKMQLRFTGVYLWVASMFKLKQGFLVPCNLSRVRSIHVSLSSNVPCHWTFGYRFWFDGWRNATSRILMSFCLGLLNMRKICGCLQYATNRVSYPFEGASALRWYRKILVVLLV